jgi:hypothetical protein
MLSCERPSVTLSLPRREAVGLDPRLGCSNGRRVAQRRSAVLAVLALHDLGG